MSEKMCRKCRQLRGREKKAVCVCGRVSRLWLLHCLGGGMPPRTNAGIHRGGHTLDWVKQSRLASWTAARLLRPTFCRVQKLQIYTTDFPCILNGPKGGVVLDFSPGGVLLAFKEMKSAVGEGGGGSIHHIGKNQKLCFVRRKSGVNLLINERQFVGIVVRQQLNLPLFGARMERRVLSVGVQSAHWFCQRVVKTLQFCSPLRKKDKSNPTQ